MIMRWRCACKSRHPFPGSRLGGEITATLWRDWLTDEVLAELALNDRQVKALRIIRQQSHMTNSDYQTLTGATRPTAKRDLEALVRKGVIVRRGSGRGAHYGFTKKRLTNGSNGPKGGEQ